MFVVCVNHGVGSRYAGSDYSAVKYLVLWKMWRPSVDGMKTEKVFQIFSCCTKYYRFVRNIHVQTSKSQHFTVTKRRFDAKKVQRTYFKDRFRKKKVP